MGKSRIGLIALTTLISLLVAVNSVNAASYTESSPYRVPFVYGDKNETTGEICVWSDDTNLYVKIMSDYAMSETHLAVSKYALTWYPPGQWPYKHENLPSGTKNDTYCIPLVDIAISCDELTTIYMMAHGAIPDGPQGPNSAYGKEFKGSFSFDITRSCGSSAEERPLLLEIDPTPPLPEMPTVVTIAIGLISIAFLVRRNY